MGVTKMGNIVHRMGIEPTSLAFRASVLPLHHVGSLISPLYPRPSVFAPPCLRGKWLLHSSPWNCKSFNSYNYIHRGNGLTYVHTQGRFNNHIACSLYRIMVTPTSVVGVMQMGNTVLGAGLKPTSLTFRSRVWPFHHIGSLMPPLYTCPPLCRSLPQRSVQTTTHLLSFFCCYFIEGTAKTI